MFCEVVFSHHVNNFKHYGIVMIFYYYSSFMYDAEHKLT